MKTFSKWTIGEVEDTFNLVVVEEFELLKEWLRMKVQPSEEEKKLLDKLSRKLHRHAWDWNESELRFNFISPLLLAVDFDQENYQPFADRELTATFEDETLSGVADFLVASGRRSPKHPFFFINEYKKEHDSSNDPFGQLMAAMIAAQKLNNDNNPLYGAYVLGRFWFFVTLNGREYSVSEACNAAKKDEIREIFCILNNTKTIIDELIHKQHC
ncbi:MAG: hypothetical protein DRI57_27670 [Deltaproteobacteria bacterium]|nr:MAG: hypothetical protein DRI57_27670 [Deltaproteobacteria bacterium]